MGELATKGTKSTKGFCFALRAFCMSLVKAWKADKSGNLIFRRTARNFNPACAMAGKITIVEVEEIVETGSIDPDAVHLPGIYVHRIVLNATPEKRIEKRTVTAAALSTDTAGA